MAEGSLFSAGVFTRGLFAAFAYLAATAWVARAERWSLWRTALAALASVPPLTTLLLERWMSRRRPAEAAPNAARRAVVRQTASADGD